MFICNGAQNARNFLCNGAVGRDLFLGATLAGSGPLLQKSQGAIFPREISDFGTLNLSSRSLKVLYFLGGTLALSPRSLKLIWGLYASAPEISKCYTS